MRHRLAFAGRVFASLAAVGFSLVLAVVAIVFVTISIAGCAICDNAPPNYPAVGGVAIVWLLLQLVVVGAWRAACPANGYRS